MANMLYIEINIFCIAILGIILLRQISGINKSQNSNIITAIIVCAILFICFDILWRLDDAGYTHINHAFDYTINTLHFVFSTATAFLWFIYSETQQNSILVTNRKYRILCMIPIICVFLMIITTFKTGLVFYIDSGHQYHRGICFPVQQLVSYGYVVVTATKAFLRSIKKKNYINRNKYRALALFAVLPMTFGILQAVFYDATVLCMGIAFGMLQFYLNNQELLISVDYLTKLGNRGIMETVLSDKIKNYDSSKQLFLLMMDVDRFKSINDNFGHIEGDKALIRISKALQAACNNECFVSRYGGDEFIIIYETQNESSVNALCDNINKKLAELNNAENAPYDLTVSIGYAKYSPAVKYIPDFISLADSMLYQKKRQLAEQMR